MRRRPVGFFSPSGWPRPPSPRNAAGANPNRRKVRKTPLYGLGNVRGGIPACFPFAPRLPPEFAEFGRMSGRSPPRLGHSPRRAAATAAESVRGSALHPPPGIRRWRASPPSRLAAAPAARSGRPAMATGFWPDNQSGAQSFPAAFCPARRAPQKQRSPRASRCHQLRPFWTIYGRYPVLAEIRKTHSAFTAPGGGFFDSSSDCCLAAVGFPQRPRRARRMCFDWPWVGDLRPNCAI